MSPPLSRCHGLGGNGDKTSGCDGQAESSAAYEAREKGGLELVQFPMSAEEVHRHAEKKRQHHDACPRNEW